MAETDSEREQLDNSTALERPKLQRDTLSAVLASTDAREWKPLFYATGIDDAVMAMPSNEFVDDKPSFRAAVNGADRTNWFAAMDREHANLTNHDAYTEVPEDSFTTCGAVSTKGQRGD